MVTEPIITIQDVGLRYKNTDDSYVTALSGVNATIQKGEIVTIVGSSGCGKSSLLLLLSGLMQPTSGSITYRGKKIRTPSRERAIIFQDYALFPWKTAVQNIEFVLRARQYPREEVREEALRYLRLVHLEKYADRYPHELSGGMEQRVGIARMLSSDPEILLLDEPFVSLDNITRNHILQEVITMVRRLKKTLILVTHNIEEAVFVGERIFVMSGQPGQIIKEIKADFSKPKHLTDTRYDSAYIRIEKEIHHYLSG